MTEFADAFPVTAEEWHTYPYPTTPETVVLPARYNLSAYQSNARPTDEGFLPAETCAECHSSIYETYRQTAHARTSGRPSEVAIPASFDPPDNRLKTFVDSLYFEAGREEGRLFQEVIVIRDNQEYRHRTPIDVVIGSGSHGQSYVYQHEDRLYMHQVGYFHEPDVWTGWANGPGFIDGVANLARPVTPSCLDCHATFLAYDDSSANRYDLSSAIFGIACVRCHGPGTDHVEYHRAHPDETEPHAIVNPADLDRDRRSDVCGHCHSGRELTAAFRFQPGDVLADMLQPAPPDTGESGNDPHTANQQARLARSECYIQSAEMTCVTCHDPHAPRSTETTGHAGDCTQCHAPTNCGIAERLDRDRLLSECIDCHMPVVPESGFEIDLPHGTTVTRPLRDHFIRIVGGFDEAAPDAAGE